MAINLEAALAGGVPERLNRQGAQARQERWLAQLQEALFVSDEANASGKRGEVPRSRADERRRDAARSGTADGQRAPAEGRPQRQGKAQHAGNAVAPAAASPASLTGLEAALPGGCAPAGAPSTLAASASAALPAAAPAAAGHGAAAVPQQASLAAASGPGWPGGAPAPVAQGGDAAAQAAEAASAQPELAPAADATAGGAAAAAPQEAYAARLLHLLPDGQGVHAWVRDARLLPGQLAAVAAALAGELAAGGQPLAALSINGKRLPDGALRAATGHARRHAFNAYTAGAQLSPAQPGKA